MKQKNSKNPGVVNKTKSPGNPKCYKSETISRPDKHKKSGGGTVKNVY